MPYIVQWFRPPVIILPSLRIYKMFYILSIPGGQQSICSVSQMSTLMIGNEKILSIIYSFNKSHPSVYLMPLYSKVVSSEICQAIAFDGFVMTECLALCLFQRFAGMISRSEMIVLLSSSHYAMLVSGQVLCLTEWCLPFQKLLCCNVNYFKHLFQTLLARLSMQTVSGWRAVGDKSGGDGICLPMHESFKSLACNT